jgi:hypothetical protein
MASHGVASTACPEEHPGHDAVARDMSRKPHRGIAPYSARMSRSPLLLGTGGERERATRAGVTRICIGGSMVLTTGLGRRIFGIPAAQDNGGGLRLAARLFGIRNVVLGTWSLLAREQGIDERRLCYRLNAAVDAADLAVLAWAGVRGQGLVRAALMGGALGGTALLAWLDLLGDLEDAAPERGSAAA